MDTLSKDGPKTHDFAGIKKTEPLCKFDYSVFDGCFGEKFIRPSDIDFVVERKGWFLVGEFKAYSGKVSKGQSILLKELGLLPNFTTFVAYGIPPTTINEWYYGDPHHEEQWWDSFVASIHGGSDSSSLRMFMVKWYKQANKKHYRKGGEDETE